MKKILFTLYISGSLVCSYAQSIDTTRNQVLDPVTVEGVRLQHTAINLNPVQGTYLYAGKKSEVISLGQLNANISEKTPRQIFAKIPGVFVYDMDGSGNQINISARGLDPHRGWEFNLRKDGILTNSDMYAYPASHYSVPLESIEKIELVRGTGSLQYGAQFGGMINYLSKKGDTTRHFGFESFSTVGSYNLMSTYNAIGGRVGKFSYYAYIAKRSRDGYRKNEHTDYEAAGINLDFQATASLNFRLSWAKSSYLYRIPGPLTDAMFRADPQQATRSRNYFSPTIHIPSLTIQWNASANTSIQWVSSAVLGNRSSVLYDKLATVKDSINPVTNQYNNRQVDIDEFNSYTHELRVLQHYNLGYQRSTLVSGVQLMHNDLHRQQLGKGTTGSDYDLSLVSGTWGRDLHFKTKNLALFVENSLSLGEKLTANMGARLEIGESNMTGSISYYPENSIPVRIQHHYTLLGGSFSYKPTHGSEIYGGFAQAYRPMIFKDLIPASIYEKVDENIKDAQGYNAEIGWRGHWKSLKWDITGFLLPYNNRFGTLAMQDANGNFYTYRTNIGNSLTKGVELFVQGYWPLGNKTSLSAFTSTALVDGRYTSGQIKTGNQNIALAGKKIESVPNLISRNSLTFTWLNCSITALYSYTAESYADALNTLVPSETGAVGLVPAYGILDVNATYRVSSKLAFKTSLSNLTNKSYFTKRPLFYPGPGVWPSDGINGNVSVVLKL